MAPACVWKTPGMHATPGISGMGSVLAMIWEDEAAAQFASHFSLPQEKPSLGCCPKEMQGSLGVPGSPVLKWMGSMADPGTWEDMFIK